MLAAFSNIRFRILFLIPWFTLGISPLVAIASPTQDVEQLKDSLDFYLTVQLDSAMAYANRLESAALAKGDSAYLMEATLRKGCLYFWMGNGEDAQRYLEHALKLGEVLGSAYVRASSLQTLAALITLRNSRLEGLEYYRQAEALIPELTDALLKGRINFGLGDVYFAQQDYPSSFIYYNKALSSFQEAKDSLGLAKTWLNLGQLAIRRDSLEEARDYFESAAKVFASVERNFWLGSVMAQLGALAIEESRPEEAILYFDSSLVLVEPYYSLGIDLAAWQGKAEAYLLLGKYALSRQFVQKEIEVAERKGAGRRLLEGWAILQKINEAEGRWQAAVALANQQLALSDSLSRVENLQEIQWLEEEFNEQRAQDAKGFEQRTELLLLQEEAERSDLYQRVLAFGLLIISLFLAILWLSFVRVRKARRLAIQQQQVTRQQAWDIRAQNDLLEEQQAKIIQQRDQLKESNDIKNTIFSIISHDLRSPLSSLNNMLVLLQTGVQLTPKELNKILDQTSGSVKGLLHSLDNLLRWSLNQMENPNTLEPKSLEVASMVIQSRHVFTPLIHAKEIEFVWDTADPDLKIFADEDSVQLVFRNLISNAVKFTPRKGKITVGARGLVGMTEVWVEDTGRGLSEEKLSTLFKGYVKSARGTENEKGTGLGLSLCQEFVHLNGGEIGVENAEGGGARFWFRLPSQGGDRTAVTCSESVKVVKD